MSNIQATIQIFTTPRIAINTYGTEIDITDFVDFESIGEIREFIDSEDYDFGLFSFGELSITVNNEGGEFNGPEDSRSIFPFLRDIAKIKIIYRETTVTLDANDQPISSSDSDTILYQGIIRDEATRFDPQLDVATLLVLSRDSIIAQNKVSEGAIADASLASDGIKTILNVPRITSLLTFDPAKIVLDQDFTIDDGSFFDNLNSLDAIKNLLLIANSVLIINASDEIEVKSRDEDTVPGIMEFVGRYQTDKEENIIDLTEFNNGFHRMFNSIRFETFESNDTGHIEEFGLRQRQITASFLTNTATLGTVGTSMLNEFKVPKFELFTRTFMSFGKDASLLRRTRIFYPLKLEPEIGKFFPYFGHAVYNDADTPYPQFEGSIEISPNIAFKIIERTHNINTFETTIKHRQTGKNFGEGYYA